MKNLCYILFLFSINQAFSQGAIDGYMKGKGTTDFALTYSYEHFDLYYFGDRLQKRENTTQTVSLFMEHAFRDSLDLVIAFPYMWTDTFNRSLQDAIVALKYRNVRKHYNSGALSVITSAGLSFPLARYPVTTERPIGSRSLIFQTRLLAQYEFKMGLFVHLQSGLDFQIAPRLQYAIPVVVRAGYAGSKFYVDVWVDFYHTINAGTNTTILGGEGPQWWKLGGTFYYPISPTFGVFVGGAYYVTGRNIGLANRGNVGIVYKWVKKK